MRHALPVLSCLLALLLRAPDLPAADETRPYDAYLPNPEWTESDPRVPYHAVRVLDAATGKPLEGARLAGYDEDIDARTIRYAPLLRESRSNADGIAWVPAFEDLRIDHWVVSHDGHAPAYHFGYEPPAVVRLVRGVSTRVRLADTLGTPLSDLDLEVFLGCIHGPVGARLRSGGDGHVAIPPFDPEQMVRLWCEAPGIVARMKASESLFYDAARGVPALLERGRTLTGRVVGVEGRGLADVVVRGYGAQPPTPGEDPGFLRGPATRTAEDGRFVLHGLPGRDAACGVLVIPPGAKEPVHWRVPPLRAPRLVMRIPLTPAPGVGEAPGFLRMHARDASGGALPRLPHAVAVREDGLIEDRLAATPGFANDLLPGRWTVAVLSDFAATTFDTFEVEIGSGERVEREVVVTQQPRSALAGVPEAVESLGSFEVHTPYEARTVTVGELQDGRLSLPTGVPVALVTEDGVVTPFGPLREGRRAVTLRPHPRHVLHFDAPGPLEDLQLRVQGVDLGWAGPLEGTRLETDLRCEAVAQVVLEDGRAFEVPLDLRGEPRERRVDVVAAGRALARPGPVTLTWRMADGSVPEDVELEAECTAPGGSSLSVSGATPPETEIEGPCRVVLRGPGLQPLRTELEPGTHELVWGPCDLLLEAFGPDGERVQAVVMVDGELHRDFGDRPLRLRGLARGPHRMVVTPFDLRWRGVELQVGLDASTTRKVVRFTQR